MNLMKMRMTIHSQLLNLRNIDYQINALGFERAWDNADEAERKEVIADVLEGRSERIKDWVKKVLSKELECKPVAELRKIAARMRIRDYNHFNKATLLFKIKKGQDEQEGQTILGNGLANEQQTSVSRFKVQ